MQASVHERSGLTSPLSSALAAHARRMNNDLVESLESLIPAFLWRERCWNRLCSRENVHS